jgi:hypothetical protein
MAGTRFRYWAVGLAGAVLVGATVAVRAATAPAPSGYAAEVVSCDLTGPGPARVGYAVTNHDGVAHGYRVLVTVSVGSTPLGWGESQVNRVGPGETATARVPVTLTGTGAGATCAVHAEVNDGRSGHHADPPSATPR